MNCNCSIPNGQLLNMEYWSVSLICGFDYCDISEVNADLCELFSVVILIVRLFVHTEQ